MKEGVAMLKIAVCDDEQAYLDKTRGMLEQYTTAHDMEITAEAFLNPSALLTALRQESATISICWTSTCPVFPV